MWDSLHRLAASFYVDDTSERAAGIRSASDTGGIFVDQKRGHLTLTYSIPRSFAIVFLSYVPSPFLSVIMLQLWSARF